MMRDDLIPRRMRWCTVHESVLGDDDWCDRWWRLVEEVDQHVDIGACLGEQVWLIPSRIADDDRQRAARTLRRILRSADVEDDDDILWGFIITLLNDLTEEDQR